MIDSTVSATGLAGAAIGTFDGVHIGHAEVLRTLREASLDRGLKPLAISFDRHPLALICPERAPLSLTTPERKVELLANEGVTPIILPFNERLRATTATDWMKMIHDDLKVRLLVVGYDNKFGCDGKALSVSDYREIGEKAGIEVIAAPVVEGVSSSAIRKAVTEGDMSLASQMLGRYFSFPGTVVAGNRLGRTIGFPTANISLLPGMVPPGKGVYAGTVSLEGDKEIPAVVNVGVRPTVKMGGETTIEAHLIGWHGDAYGKGVEVSLHTRLRDEKMFDSIDSLRVQIEKDTASAEVFLKESMKARK